MVVGLLDLFLGEAERGQKIKARRIELLRGQTELVLEQVVAQRPSVKDEAQLEGGRQLAFDAVEHLLGEALALRLVRLTCGQPARVPVPRQ